MTAAAKIQDLIEALSRGKASAATLAAIDELARTSRASWPVIELLSEQPTDPRIAVIALGLLRDFGKLPHTRIKLWRRLMDTVEAHGDASHAKPLAALRIPTAKLPATYVADVTTRRRNVVARLAKPRKPKKAKKAAPENPDADALLAAVYADPSDLAARAVYADALSEAGDERGEFITLQLQPKLSAAGNARAAELLTKHGKAWLGPLTKYVDRQWWNREPAVVGPGQLEVATKELEGFVFANGFVVRVPALEVPTQRIPEVYDNPLWATVESADHLDVFTAQMRSLREARSFTDAIPTLSRLGHALERLGTGSVKRKHLAAARGVRHLRNDTSAAEAWAGLAVLGKENAVLETFTCGGMYTARWHEGDLAASLAGLSKHLVMLRWMWQGGETILERKPGKAWDVLTIRQRKFDPAGHQIALEPFENGPKLAELRSTYPKSLLDTAPEITGLAKKFVSI